jgi:copper resistance protein B
MIFKQKNINALAFIALSLSAAWGTQAMAADNMAAMESPASSDAPAMQGGSAPAKARDPHAYSGGYDFGMYPRMKMSDEAIMAGMMINRLERVQTGNSTYFNAYDLQGWVGKDYERLVIKAEGEINEDKIHEARTELLWGHAISAYWNTQLGARHDSGVAPSRNWLAVGVQGLAPYWFEIDATAYVGDQGRTALRLGAEYELLLTQKLILQPRIEANFYGMQDEEREIGSGLSTLVTGLRLRYEFHREFAPYVGIDWNSKFGRTADYAKAAGANPNNTNVVAGLRVWF